MKRLGEPLIVLLFGWTVEATDSEPVFDATQTGAAHSRRIETREAVTDRIDRRTRSAARAELSENETFRTARFVESFAGPTSYSSSIEPRDETM
ncbi:MAG: hypothetical protein ACO3QC_06540 [Phycisphaerales bacterium]